MKEVACDDAERQLEQSYGDAELDRQNTGEQNDCCEDCCELE
jgi:hypothetical protein